MKIEKVLETGTTLAVYGGIAFACWKLWPVVKAKLNSTSLPSTGTGTTATTAQVIDPPTGQSRLGISRFRHHHAAATGGTQ